MPRRKLYLALSVFTVMAMAGIYGVSLLMGVKASAPVKRDVVVALVGKDRIYLAALNLATAPYKYRLEQEGYDFGSPRGQSLYQQLQVNVLNNLIARTLFAQGAAARKITLSTAELKRGYKKELKERKQSEAGLLKELRRYGWTKSIFLADLKRRLLEEKFIERFVAKGKSGTDREAAINGWLYEHASAVGIRVFFQTGAAGGDILAEAEREALKYYRNKYGAGKDVTAKAANYGCHIQVDIIKNGKVIKSLGYGGGQVYEI
ncbi:MAG: SurA N-terminal domain-containing protein [Patescibacteria group bacterium]